MPVDVVTETIIRRPVAEVAAYAADPATAPSWYENIKSAEWATQPPVRVGSRFRFTARFLGKTLAYTYEVAAHEPGRRLVMPTAEGPFPMETTYTWEPVGADATRMTLRNRGSPAGFSRLLAPFMAMAMRRATTKDLARIKAKLEAR
ncbi:MAG: hypothetical protein QOI63_751 [Thermoplasmata archaeon]|nr:hypothetical protein [Thermoplasmata archaeon]